MRMRVFALSAPVALLLAAGIVGADYYGLLGTRKQSFLAYPDVSFEPRDQASGAPISDVHVNCFRKGSRHACSERVARGRTTVYAKFGVVMVRTRTWLFTKGTAVRDPDMPVHVMFIHPDYDRVTRTFTVADLMRLQHRAVRVELPRLAP